MSATPPTFSFVVPAKHPMLAGHFPGEPIVPGAYLLATIEQLARRWLQHAPAAAASASSARLATVRVVKFTHPVRPGQECRVVFSNVAGGIRFVITHGDVSCATGTLSLSGDTVADPAG